MQSLVNINVAVDLPTGNAGTSARISPKAAQLAIELGMAGAAFFIAGAMGVTSTQLASILLAGGAGALYLSQSAFWSISADIGGNSAGAVSGFMNMIGQFGGVATASLTPWIARNWGWNSSFLVAAALCACGALAWIGVERALGEMQITHALQNV